LHLTQTHSVQYLVVLRFSQYLFKMGAAGLDGRSGRPTSSMGSGTLSFEEKKFLLAVERGDVASTKRMLTSIGNHINIDCVDPLGRTALLMAIDNENLEMVELLLENKVETKDALLHAINEEYVEAVEVLLDHEESIHKEGEPWSWEAMDVDIANFTPDISPLILAAHTDNYEVIKILLDRGAVLPCPHHQRCACEDCTVSRIEDSLRHSRSRINAYRALASPSLIALSSKDPILTAFELSWELRQLAFAEYEFKSEYLGLRKQCQDFATALLDHTRSSYELEVLLNYDPDGPAYQHGERMHLNRLKLAIKYKQKRFVAHPNVQQLLASIWYEGLPGFRQKNMILQGLEVCRIGLLFPLFSLCYIFCPWVSISQVMRKPFIKFICNSSSYFTFLFLLILASQRIEDIVGWDLPSDTTKRGSLPSVVEYGVLAWVAGLIWSEIKQLWDVGLKEYVSDLWNVVDFITNSLYVATIGLRLRAYYDVQHEISLGLNTSNLPREKWDTWDPTLISEGLFAAANIFSSLKLVYIFSVNPHLGPLQVSLGRMILDICKFCFLYLLVLFSFSCGMNQLLWYYADLEKQKCLEDMKDSPAETMFQIGGRKSSKVAYERSDGEIVIEINHCLAYRKFANLWETTQTLFWAAFGLIDLDNFELSGIKEFTRFWGLIMFGTFSIINIIVLLNLLIAMMNHSYQLISVSSEKADTEWKFARSKLWISYFEEGGTVPPPFNIIPTPKSLYYIFRWIHNRCFGQSSKMIKEHIKSVRRKVTQASERDIKYQAIIRNLVRRYVTQEQRKAENEGVTEDDVNEIKNDISAFRFELIEIMRASGMNTQSATGPSGPGGKKNRQKERRLMKGFLSTAGTISTCGPSPSTCPATANNLNQSSKIQFNPPEVKLDIPIAKKTPNLGLHRIAKLLGSENKSNRPLESLNTNGTVDTCKEREQSTVSVVQEKEINQVQKKVPLEKASDRKWGRLSKGEIIIAKDLKGGVIQDTRGVAKDVPTGNSSDSGTDMNIRCNGRLQRTPRIDQDGEGVDDKESITSVTIISVPSSLMDASITTSGRNSTVNNSPVLPVKSQHLKIEHCNNYLMKQASLPAPSIIQKHATKRCQTPNSGWL